MTPVEAACKHSVVIVRTIYNALASDDGLVHDLGRPDETRAIFEGQKTLSSALKQVTLTVGREPVRTIGASTSLSL
jgi:hypothetical protein